MFNLSFLYYLNQQQKIVMNSNLQSFIPILLGLWGNHITFHAMLI